MRYRPMLGNVEICIELRDVGELPDIGNRGSLVGSEMQFPRCCGALSISSSFLRCSVETWHWKQMSSPESWRALDPNCTLGKWFVSWVKKAACCGLYGEHLASAIRTRIPEQHMAAFLLHCLPHPRRKYYIAGIEKWSSEIVTIKACVCCT